MNSVVSDMVTYVSNTYVKELSKKLKSLFSSMKDPTPKDKHRTLYIYTIKCNDCPATYTAITSLYLHRRSINIATTAIKTFNDNPNALVSHHLNTGHKFKFNNTKIKHYENNYLKKCILEIVEIKSDSQSINFRTDTQNISSSYPQLIKTVRS